MPKPKTYKIKKKAKKGKHNKITADIDGREVIYFSEAVETDDQIIEKLKKVRKINV